MKTTIALSLVLAISSFSAFASTVSCNTVSKKDNEFKSFYFLGKTERVVIIDATTGISYEENYGGLSIVVQKKSHMYLSDENDLVNLNAKYEGRGVYRGILKLSTEKEAFSVDVLCSQVN